MRSCILLTGVLWLVAAAEGGWKSKRDEPVSLQSNEHEDIDEQPEEAYEEVS